VNEREKERDGENERERERGREGVRWAWNLRAESEGKMEVTKSHNERGVDPRNRNKIEL
jgi:hypothetical protein